MWTMTPAGVVANFCVSRTPSLCVIIIDNDNIDNVNIGNNNNEKKVH